MGKTWVGAVIAASVWKSSHLVFLQQPQSTVEVQRGQQNDVAEIKPRGKLDPNAFVKVRGVGETECALTLVSRFAAGE